MTTRRGPKLIIVATCDGCEFHHVKPDGQRYCDALDGMRIEHPGVPERCPHTAELIRAELRSVETGR